MRIRRLSVILAALAVVLSAAPAAVADGDHPALTPAEVDRIIFPGESVDLDKVVHTTAIPPLVDICLVEDETGSFGDDIANLVALAPNLVTALDASGSDYATCVIGFRDFARSTWGGSNDWVYHRYTDVSAGGGALLTGVGMLSAGGGFDGPEAQLEALHYLADPAHAAIDSNGDGDTVDAMDTPAGLQPTWRPGAKRVVLLATDAPCHVTGDAGGWPGDAGTIDALTTAGILAGAGITVIGLTPGGSGFGCVDVLAGNAGPGGSVQATTSSGSDIVDAIIAGLGNLPVEVSMNSTCTWPISTTFSPATKTVTSGEHAVFTETIAVAADAPGGDYTCRDWAMVDGEPMRDPDTGQVIFELKTILVPENFVTGGGFVTNGEKGKDRIGLLNFGGNAGYLEDGTLVGHWSFNVRLAAILTGDAWKFQTTEITALQFVDSGGDPAPPEADADTAIMTATGRGNFGDGWIDGCTIEVTFHDGGEPQQDGLSDMFMVCPGGGFGGVADLTGGNIQIHDGTK